MNDSKSIKYLKKINFRQYLSDPISYNHELWMRKGDSAVSNSVHIHHSDIYFISLNHTVRKSSYHTEFVLRC